MTTTFKSNGKRRLALLHVAPPAVTSDNCGLEQRFDAAGKLLSTRVRLAQPPQRTSIKDLSPDHVIAAWRSMFHGRWNSLQQPQRAALGHRIASLVSRFKAAACVTPPNRLEIAVLLQDGFDVKNKNKDKEYRLVRALLFALGADSKPETLGAAIAALGLPTATPCSVPVHTVVTDEDEDEDENENEEAAFEQEAGMLLVNEIIEKIEEDATAADAAVSPAQKAIIQKRLREYLL